MKKIKFQIHGMHCTSCEVLIERKFKKVAGVEKVHVSHHNGKAEILCSRERGIYPRSVTVKKGLPVDLSIDTKVPLGGCMSVWVIPEYNITIPMKIGVNKASFTPTKVDTAAMTCSMGGRIAQLEVVN